MNSFDINQRNIAIGNEVRQALSLAIYDPQLAELTGDSRLYTAVDPTYANGLQAVCDILDPLGYQGVNALGPAGSNSDKAARDILNNMHKSLVDGEGHSRLHLITPMARVVSRALTTKDTASLVPIANTMVVATIGGMVACTDRSTNMGVLQHSAAQHKLAVHGVVDVPIEHSLIGRQDVDLTHLKGRSVYTHPQALGQCAAIIAKNGLRTTVPHSKEPAVTPSTSAAAEALSEGRISSEAVVIAPSEVTEIYDGLRVIEHDIGDWPASRNITIMALVGVKRLL